MTAMTIRVLTLVSLAFGICVVASAVGLAPEAQAADTTATHICTAHSSFCPPVINQPCLLEWIKMLIGAA